MIWLTQGGLNSKLHAVTDALGRSICMLLTAGNVSDNGAARALTGSLPQADWMLADRGYNADWFCNGWNGMNIEPCIPSRKSRKVTIPCDRTVKVVRPEPKTLLIGFESYADTLSVKHSMLLKRPGAYGFHRPTR